MTDMQSAPIVGSSFAAPTPDVVGVVIPHFDTESEEALALRYGRLKKKHEDIVFEFTRDPALLHQYFELCQTECRMVQQFIPAEEEYNRIGNIMVVRKGNFCLGGARLSSRTPRKTKSLPMEIEGFSLNKQFLDLESKQLNYGELSRLVLLPEFRTGDITRQMFFHLYRKSVALGLSFVFAAAPKLNVRTYRQHFLAIGLKETKIYYDIVIPPYPGFQEVKDYLFSVTIDESFIPVMQNTIPAEAAIKCVEEA